MTDIDLKPYHKIRIITGVSILLVIALIHAFRLGSYLNGEAYIFYYSYVSDVILPFGIYFLLCMNEVQIRFLRKWYVKALIVFGVATFTEIMQAFDIYFFGVTFDYFDILAFGIGVLLAVLLDKLAFERSLPYWKLPG